MEQSIKKKLNLLYKCIEEAGGIIDFDWCDTLLYPYYKHFNDNNKTYRTGSLIAFLSLLNEWEDQSEFPFCRGFGEYECHHFEKYMEEFLKYSKKIKRQYPNIFFAIIKSLAFLDNRDVLEKTFPIISHDFFIMVRKQLFNDNIQRSNNIYIEALKEAGIYL